MSRTKISQEQLGLLSEYMREKGSKSLFIQPIARESLHGVLPLSFAQQRLWFLDQLQHNSPAYNIAIAYRIKGEINIAALEQSMNEIIRRHEVLRASFKTIDGQPVQVIAPELTLKFVVKNLEQFSIEQREVEMQRRATAEAREPFDLAIGPLLRSKLLRLNEREHILLLTVHHIVFDGWSMGTFYWELAELYNAHIQGKPSPLPKLPIQYVDFAYWQREWLQGEVLQAELGYWKQQLADVSTVLELPSDRPRPAIQTFQGGLYSFALPKALSLALKSLSRQEDCTLFQTLLAAFQVLLHRYTGQHDIVVGSPIANRNHIEIEKLIGFFANTLVMRSDLSGNPTFRELLSQVREMTLDAYAHQDLPFEKLVDELQPQRDLSHAALIQVLFVLQNASDVSLRLVDLDVCPLEISNGTTKFDVSLELVDTEDGLTGSIQYSLDLFDYTTIARMVGHLQTLLEGIVTSPQHHISDLPLLTASQYQQVQVEWNATTADYDSNQCLHQLVEVQVERTPDAIAVIFEEESLTYRALNARANQLAHYLQQQGVGPETLVGICVERSLEMAVGLLGVLKAGGVCVPLDPEYPQERLAFMIQDAHVAILLTQQHLLERLPVQEVPVLCLDAEWNAITQQPSQNPSGVVMAEQSAYVIYTSGSTGTPKGVVVRHSSLCNRLYWGQMAHPLTEVDCVLQEASFSFDFAIWEFFGPLAVGARVILARPGGQRDIEYLIELIIQHNVTILHLIPSLLRVFLEQPEVERCGSVRHVYGGAEPLPLDLWRNFAKRMKAQLHNVYGPTEATIDTTCWTGDGEGDWGMVPIGKPIANAQVYLLDQYYQPTPIGVSGEIYIGGAGLARGYLNRPEVTAERFVPHPFSSKPGERLYRTGDVARYLPDGNLEYMGRVDNQVKVRGFRIELGEVEVVLKSHPGVRDAVVVAREDKPGEKRLVAYLVPEDGQVPHVTELRHFLQKKLPDYMVPAWFVTLDAFPLTPNGKLDRQSLLAPDSERPDLEESYIAPRTPAEGLLADIWTQVLGIEQVGIHDNFFALGGDSIRSVQIVARARASGLFFSVQQLFRHQTIAELIEDSILSEGSLQVLPRTKPFDLVCAADRQKLPIDVEDAYPLTALQTGMFYHMEMTMDVLGAPDYHNVDSYYYRAPFDSTTFQRAVTRVVLRHPALRTSFDLTSYSELLQLVHRTAMLLVQEEDIRHYTITEQEYIIRRFVEKEQNNRFDMSKPPLLRFHIHRRTDDSFQFTFTEYHPIIDGWSIHSILAEIFNDYFSMLNNDASREEEPIETSFRDYVALEKMSLQSEACQQYWASKLADHNRLELPKWTQFDPKPEDQRYSKIAVSIPLDVAEGLRQLARSSSVSLKSVLFAAHVKVMSLLSGQTDVLTGQLSNGRLEVVGGERVVGLFLNILPLRLNVTGGTWLDLVHQTFEVECEVLPYRRYPLAEMQAKWGGRTPLLNTVFSYFDFHVFNDLFDAGQIEHLGFKITSHNVGFVLNALFFASAPERRSSQIFFDLAYETAKLSEQDAIRVGEYYIAVMKAMVENPLKHYDHTSVLPAIETKRVLTEWNATTADYDSNQCLHQLVEVQVERTPDAIAVIFEEESLTYRALNARANQLAHYLQQQGVGPETLVGICVERSLEMAVGLLGVLKAGGVCVPLDPEYPQERLAFMIQDAHVAILLTQQHLLERLPVQEVPVLCLDAEWNAITQQPSQNPSGVVMAEQSAYVIYTSGSTGTPKGVVVRHSSLCNRLYWGQMAHPLTEVDCVLQEASFSFDFAIWEFFGPLAVGARVILARPGGQRDIEYLIELIIQHNVTILHLIPSLLRVFLEQPEVERCGSVRHVYGGAEPLPLDLWRNFAKRMKAQLHNVYGPTEATIDTTCWTGDGEGDWGMVPIGKPIANAQVYLLDQYYQPTPIGVSGEIYIGGAGLARGYLNRPEVTAERFVPHPFSSKPGERLYRTGDVARYLPDGNLEYMGRVDNQVKVRGFRIELGEVEVVLKSHPGVRDAVVVAREDKPGEKRLVAYLVPEDGQVPHVTELRHFLQKKLPDYMVPAWFVTLDAFPLTPNGKLDHQALPEFTLDQIVSDRDMVAPRGPLEQMLVSLWKDLLGQTHISIHDDFFELGGDSLLVIHLIARLRATFSIRLTPQELLESATIADLSDIVLHRLIERVGSVASEQLLAELGQLSEDEA